MIVVKIDGSAFIHRVQYGILLSLFYCIIKTVLGCSSVFFMIVSDLTLLIFNQNFALNFPVLFSFVVTVLNLCNNYTWLKFAVDLGFHNQTTAAVNLSLFFFWVSSFLGPDFHHHTRLLLL